MSVVLSAGVDERDTWARVCPGRSLRHSSLEMLTCQVMSVSCCGTKDGCLASQIYWICCAHAEPACAALLDTSCRIAPSHVPTLARAAKLTAAQSAALTAAANSSPAANVVALALVRDNAVSHLHLRVQQAAAGAASASSTRSMGLGSSTSGIGGTAFGWVLPAGSTSAIVVPGTNAAAEHLVVALFSQLHCPPPGGQLSIAT
jgi:hypothetical protein